MRCGQIRKSRGGTTSEDVEVAEEEEARVETRGGCPCNPRNRKMNLLAFVLTSPEAFVSLNFFPMSYQQLGSEMYLYSFYFYLLYK